MDPSDPSACLRSTDHCSHAPSVQREQLSPIHKVRPQQQTPVAALGHLAALLALLSAPGSCLSLGLNEESWIFAFLARERKSTALSEEENFCPCSLSLATRLLGIRAIVLCKAGRKNTRFPSTETRQAPHVSIHCVIPSTSPRTYQVDPVVPCSTGEKTQVPGD